MEAVIAGQEAVNAWQSDIPYYPCRPVRSSLKSSEHLDLRQIPPPPIQSRIGKSNRYCTSAPVKLFFSYVNTARDCFAIRN